MRIFPGLYLPVWHLKVAAILTWLPLCGCASEVGRVPFAREGIADATLTLKAGEVDFWTDIDIKYQGAALLRYEIDLYQSGASVATASCNPLGPIDIKTFWSETNLGMSHTRSGAGRMPCSVQLPAGGSTLIKTRLVFSSRPASLVLSKADLVVKQ